MLLTVVCERDRAKLALELLMYSEPSVFGLVLLFGDEFVVVKACCESSWGLEIEFSCGWLLSLGLVASGK